MLSQVSGSGGPAEGWLARRLTSGPMSTMTSFCTASGRLAVKYMAFRPPIERPTRMSEVTPI
jgi:hypothetical protein